MKLNNTDIRTIKVYNPQYVRTVGFTATNGPLEWKYILSGDKSIPNSISLQKGVTIRNIGGTNNAVISLEGISAGTSNPIGNGYTFDGYILPTGEEIFFAVDDLSNVIVKSISSTVVGVTLSYIAI